MSPGDSQLVDAATVARMLGVSRSWVYDNAAHLGALRLGTGPRARLRFDPHVTLAALAPASRRPSAATAAERSCDLLPIRKPVGGGLD